MRWYIKVNEINKNGEEINRLGTSSNIIIDDLKTLNGVINRLKNFNFNHVHRNKGFTYTSLDIYTFTNVYNDKTYKHVKRLNIKGGKIV